MIIIGAVALAAVGGFLVYGKYVRHGLKPAMPVGTQKPVDSPTGEGQQPKEVPTIIVPKEKLEGAIADLKLSVGDVYGKFTIVKIIDRETGGPDVVMFSGEETIRGALGYSGFGAIFFQIDKEEVLKMPQILKGIYAEPNLPTMFVLNEPPTHFSRNDFHFIDEANSDPRTANVRISNLSMVIPPIDAFGSFNEAGVEFVE